MSSRYDPMIPPLLSMKFKEMMGHQEIIDGLDDDREDVLQREHSAEQSLKKSKKDQAKLQQFFSASEKVCF